MYSGFFIFKSIVLKARSKTLGILGISNFRHLLSKTLRRMNCIVDFMHTFVRGSLNKDLYQISAELTMQTAGDKKMDSNKNLFYDNHGLY